MTLTPCMMPFAMIIVFLLAILVGLERVIGMVIKISECKWTTALPYATAFGITATLMLASGMITVVPCGESNSAAVAAMEPIMPCPCK